MSQKTFRLPDLGEGLTESEIVTWRVAEGDAVTVNQVLADVETAKAVVEVSSPFAGVVAALHGAEGETLEVGAPLVTFTLEGAEPDVGGPAEGDGRVPTLVGYGAAPDTGKPGRRARRGSAAPTTSARSRGRQARVRRPATMTSPLTVPPEKCGISPLSTESKVDFPVPVRPTTRARSPSSIMALAWLSVGSSVPAWLMETSSRMMAGLVWLIRYPSGAHGHHRRCAGFSAGVE